MTEFEAGDVVRYLGSFEGFSSLTSTDIRPLTVGIILNEVVSEDVGSIDDVHWVSGLACRHVVDGDLDRCRTKYYRVWFDGIVEYVSDMDIEAIDDSPY